uniref:Uncharacterized protein n=1 Tax=Arundo donax TaxID=35708 RepID=A0A0A8ZI52_ARUDO
MSCQSEYEMEIMHSYCLKDEFLLVPRSGCGYTLFYSCKRESRATICISPLNIIDMLLSFLISMPGMFTSFKHVMFMCTSLEFFKS